MTTSKEPLRCKLEIDGRMVEQFMKFNYLGVNIASSRNLVKEIKTKAQKQQEYEWSRLEKQIYEKGNKTKNK